MMSGRHVIETVLGGLVLIVAALFVWFAYTLAQVRSVPGYAVHATFSKLGGLAAGSDVQISGITVGKVIDRTLDPATFDARITLRIDEAYRLPEDTVAGIASDGLLGGRFVRLEPGRSQALIAPGGTIRETRGYRSLEDQVGDIIFLATGGRPAEPAAQP